MTNNLISYYANDKQHLLADHLFAVGWIGYDIVNKLTNNSKLAYATLVAGCFHDIGKLDPAFQNWLNSRSKAVDVNDGVHINRGKFSFEKHPRHNEISLFLFNLLNDRNDKRLNPKQFDYATHGIYWHHSKPIRKNNYKNQAEIYNKVNNSFNADMNMELFLKEASQILESVNSSLLTYSNNVIKLPKRVTDITEDAVYALKKQNLLYKEYSENNDIIDDYTREIKENADKNIIRAAIITADRIVSTLSACELTTRINDKSLNFLTNKHLDNNSTLQTEIAQCLEGFTILYPDSQQNKAQAVVAKQCQDVNDIAVLEGPAGCGKTKIALEWAFNSNVKKIIWIAPRVNVCLGLYHDLSQLDYLKNSRIEIYTGEYKNTKTNGIEQETAEHNMFTGDIVITTIDHAINTITTHSDITALITLMNSHVIFDEYHELITMPAFNLLFAELIENKKLQGDKANTLLVSATPNYYFVNKVLKIDSSDIFDIKSFNKSKYRVNFKIDDVNNSLLTQKIFKKNTFVISNTAITAQLGFIKNMHQENGILFHSKFKKADKLSLFNTIMDNFKEGGNSEFDIMRSGPIIQSSLNISCDNMITELTTAENWLQRLGRLDRFGKNNTINEYLTVVPENIDNGQTGWFLRTQNLLKSTKAWYNFLCSNVNSNVVDINYLYALYKKFYKDEISLNEIKEELLLMLKDSATLINQNIIDPLFYPHKKVSLNKQTSKIKNNSLRGDNRFVQMAICRVVNSKKYEFPNEYAYTEDTDHTQTTIGLTASVGLIKGYGNAENNLLSYMLTKHHNIKKTKKTYNEDILLNAARNPDTPIYLSYTKEDLNAIGGEQKAHQSAIYYAICDKQPIGSISNILIG